jgi:hypothetical protein
VRELLFDLLNSQWAKAQALNPSGIGATTTEVGGLRLLSPSALNRKLVGVVGKGWAEFNNPYKAQGLAYGDFDANFKTNRANSFNMMQQVTLDRMLAKYSCEITKSDMDKKAVVRKLFPKVELATTPVNGSNDILQNIIHLHKVLWKEERTAADAEVQATLALFNSVLANKNGASSSALCGYSAGNKDASDTGRAWAAVIAYMLGDFKFLYE